MSVCIRMTPLRKSLSDIVHPHDTFGTYLDSQRKTIDAELGKLNLKAAR